MAGSSVGSPSRQNVCGFLLQEQKMEIAKNTYPFNILLRPKSIKLESRELACSLLMPLFDHVILA